jgi:Calcineurin-like phosphoesterase
VDVGLFSAQVGQTRWHRIAHPLQEKVEHTVVHQAQRTSLRVFALSDIHVDIKPNMAWLHALASTDYADATLILAGDISDSLEILHEALTCLCHTFAHVFFVPGNHELWVRRQEFPDSIAKFWHILQLCDALGVHTAPARVGTTNGTGGVWVVPLFSWYMQPEEGCGSLFVPKAGEDPSLQMWSDNYFIRWPSLEVGVTAADYFLRLNEAHLAKHYDAPVISFSHFLPRTDLIFSTPAERNAAGIGFTDPAPRFNFSRVAGCVGIEEQIRRLGAVVHAYGHQHRNRDRVIDGVRYVSRCLGYPREQQRYDLPGEGNSPMLIWDARAGVQR